ncbi:MAG TPA: hypothetical protein VF625_04390 [Longimicrobium sp.]|jgi:hypothetical protein
MRGPIRWLAFLGTSAAVGVSAALALRRAGEGFVTWEGALWMIGLALVCFGVAGSLGTLHLMTTRLPGLDEVHTFGRGATRPRPRFSLPMLWMVLTGAVLLAVATVARARLPG